jgi:hypothetical protein
MTEVRAFKRGKVPSSQTSPLLKKRGIKGVRETTVEMK